MPINDRRTLLAVLLALALGMAGCANETEPTNVDVTPTATDTLETPDDEDTSEDEDTPEDENT
jgi:PBP1b-binding outer membrane lipoprotein LpoB